MKEQEPVRNSEARLMNPLYWKRVGAAAVAVIASATIAWGVEEHFDTSGDLITKNPTKRADPVNDDKVVILDWNVQGRGFELREKIKTIAEETNADVVMLQEVEKNDVQRLHEYFASSYINYVLASRWTHALQGGYGNLIMSELPQDDVEHKTLAGNSTGDKIKHWLKGVPEDVVGLDTSAKKTVEASQEPRAIISAKITFDSSSGPKPVVFSTTHLGGDPKGNGPKVHDRQFDATLDVADQNDQEGQASIICGDLNSKREDVEISFAEKGYVTSDSDGDTTLSGKDIDVCVYKSNDILGLASTDALNDQGNLGSDHYPVVFTWPIR